MLVSLLTAFCAMFSVEMQLTVTLFSPGTQQQLTAFRFSTSKVRAKS